MSTRSYRRGSLVRALLGSVTLAAAVWMMGSGCRVASADTPITDPASAALADAVMLGVGGSGPADDLNIGLYTSTGASTAHVTPGSHLTVYVIATFTNATGLCGVMDLDGVFTASAPGGSYATPTRTNPFVGNANFDGVASASGVPSGVNGGWGIDSYTGSSPNFVAYRSDATAQPTTPGYHGGPVLAPVTTTTTIGSVTGILMGTLDYTTPAFPASVDLNFVKNNDPGYPSAIWVQNMAWSNVAVTITGGQSDSGGGTVNTYGLTVVTPEPASLAILGLSVAGMLVCRRRR